MTEFIFRAVNTSTGDVSREFSDPKECSAWVQERNMDFKRRDSATRYKVSKVKRESEQEQQVWGYRWVYGLAGFSTSWPLSDNDSYVQIPEAQQRWREREADKAYQSHDMLPWLNSSWWLDSPHYLLHYPHVSKHDPGKLAFTPSVEYGEQNRQLRMRPGTYLQRHFGDVLGATDIEHWALQFSNLNDPQECKLATTAEDIERVYVIGPGSCMSGEVGNFNSSIHPVRVYAAGDLAVAYLGELYPEDGPPRVTARAVVWPEKKRWVRLYGDEARLEDALRRAGYVHGTIDGARLLRVPESGGFVVPYLDGYVQSATDNGEYLMVGAGGINCETTSGLSEENGTQCSHCNEYSNAEMVDVRNGGRDEIWCYSCYEHEAASCNDCDVVSSTDMLFHGPDGLYRCESCHDEAVCDCYSCGDACLIIDLSTNDDHDSLCEACYTDWTQEKREREEAEQEEQERKDAEDEQNTVTKEVPV